MSWFSYTLELIVKLDLHRGLVKGICWDAAGELLATRHRSNMEEGRLGSRGNSEVTLEHSPGSVFFRRLRCVDNPLVSSLCS